MRGNLREQTQKRSCRAKHVELPLHRPSLGQRLGLLGALLTVIAHSDGSAYQGRRPWAPELAQGDGPARGWQGRCSEPHSRQCAMPGALSCSRRDVQKGVPQPAASDCASRELPSDSRCAILGFISDNQQHGPPRTAPALPHLHAAAACCTHAACRSPRDLCSCHMTRTPQPSDVSIRSS